MTRTTARPWISTVTTDRPGERVAVARSPGLEGVEFWSVTGSTRDWTIYNDGYTATHVRGPGHVQVTEPGTIHSVTGLSEPGAFFVAWIPPACMTRLAAEAELGTPLHFGHSRLELCALARAMTALEDALLRAESCLEVEQWFAETMRCLLESCFEAGSQPVRRSPQHPAVRKARELLEARFAESVSLDELAAEAGLSKFHLARSFTQAVGVPPHRYQTLLRVAAARRLLEAGESLKHTSEVSGFADEAHLTRWFKRELGVAPGAWRRALRAA